MSTRLARRLLVLGVVLGAGVLVRGAGAQEAKPPDQIEASKLSKVPRQTKFVEAEYPKEAAEKGIEAEVILLLDLDDRGKVTAVGISQSAVPAGMGFDEAALVAAQSWEFEPAELGGKPIAVQITYRYRFTLKAKAPASQPSPQPASQPAAASQPASRPSGPTRPPVVNFAGRLLERGTRLPMAGVIVTVFRDDGPTPVGFEAATDAEGGFQFYDLAPGAWKVLVDAPGYYPFRTTETITRTERLDAVYHVERSSYNPYDVTITATRPRKEVSRTVLSAQEIDKVPGGAGNPLAVVQNFAGVARADMPGQIIVRGSAPEDTQVFIDGVTVPLIYHFGGLKSVIPVGVLDSIEFYPGNFSPSYGRATGGIIDVQIKPLKPEKIGGYADVSILDTGVFLEVPLGKDAAVAVAARRSYIDFILNAAVPDDAGVTLATAPRYYDFQLLGNYRPEPAHDVRLFVFGSDDRLELLFANPAELDPGLEGNNLSNSTTFYRGLATYRYVPGPGFENLLKLSIGRDSFLLVAGQLRGDLDLVTVQAREAARWRFGERLGFTLGADVMVAVADTFFRFPLPPKEGQPMTNFDLTDTITSRSENETYLSPAAFAEGELEVAPRLRFYPGVRVDHFQVTGETIAQPRLTARWQVTDPVTVKSGAGLFVQPPTPDESDVAFGNPDLGAERALHFSAGVEVKPKKWLSVDATGFYKHLWNLVSPTAALAMDGAEVRPLIYDNRGKGRVYGLELSVRHELAHNLTGWLAYTLSRAERRDSGAGDDRLFDFDQPHILTVVASYLLPRNWQVGARFRLVSGNPNTPVVGAVFNASADRYDPIYGPVNSGRNAAFNQLDLRIDKRWIYQGWILGAYLDIQNVYNRANTEEPTYNYDYSQSSAMGEIPFFTIIGVRGEF